MIKEQTSTEIKNEFIISECVRLKNRIIQLQKEEEIAIEHSIKMDMEYGSRHKPAREALSKLRNIQFGIKSAEEDIVKLFMNYKEQ